MPERGFSAASRGRHGSRARRDLAFVSYRTFLAARPETCNARTGRRSPSPGASAISPVALVARSGFLGPFEAGTRLRCAVYSNFARLLCCGPFVPSSARPSALTQVWQADGYAT